MKILIVQESDWINRNPHQQHHLMERLSLKGHEIRVIDYEIDWKALKNTQKISKRQVFKNVAKIHKSARIDVIRPGIVRIPIFNYLSLIFSHKKEIEWQINEFEPDIIIGFGILNTYLASRAAKRKGIPFVYYLIDVLYTLIPEKSLQFLGKKIKKRIIKNSSLVMTINERLSEFAIDLGSEKEKTVVVDAGIDLNEFDPGLKGDEIREKYNINDNELILFFMGWIYHFAGVKEVAEELGKQKNDNIRLMVVGDGDAFEDLETIKYKHKLDDKLILTGKQPYNKIPEYIAACDICILPAYIDEEIMQDIVPIKIYEYMAMGKPVIATRLPGIIMEFGENNGITYIETPQDVIKIAHKMDTNNLGKKARNFVESNDWEYITNKFEKVIMGVVEVG